MHSAGLCLAQPRDCESRAREIRQGLDQVAKLGILGDDLSVVTVEGPDDLVARSQRHSQQRPVTLGPRRTGPLSEVSMLRDVGYPNGNAGGIGPAGGRFARGAATERQWVPGV